MNHLQCTRSKCLSLDFTFTKRRPSIFLHAISGSGWNAILSLVSSFLILLLASPANSQLAPDVSATAANDRSPVAVSERTDIAKGDDEQALRRELAAARA